MKEYKYALENKRILEKEKGYRAIKKNALLTMALIYPNTYQLAMSNLGYQNMYYYYNQNADIYCDRCFLPAKNPVGYSPRSLEMGLVLEQFDILAFSVSFELDYINIIKILRLAGIEPDRKKRKDAAPFLLAGGPCITSNPEPLASIFDGFFIGEAEMSADSLITSWNKSCGEKSAFISMLADNKNYYMPTFYNPQYDKSNNLTGYSYENERVYNKIQRQWIRNINQTEIFSRIITPDTEFSDMFLLEIGRGCGRQCRFCMAGYIYRCPRYRNISNLMLTIENNINNTKKIGLVSAAVSDYPDMDKLCTYITGKKLKVSVSSFRADSVSEQLISLLAASGQKTITIAPEAGSEKMISRINKNINRDDIEKLLYIAEKHGIKSIRYYIILGLPGEEDFDIESIAELGKWTVEFYKKKDIRNCEITLSTSFFVPKANTPFQWSGMTKMDTLKKRLKMLQNMCSENGNIKISGESIKWSFLQALLARGDRRVGEAMLQVNDEFGNLHLWNDILERENGVSTDYFVYREREENEFMPWDIIDQGFNKEYLYNEYKKSASLIKSAPCNFNSCADCGNKCDRGE